MVEILKVIAPSFFADAVCKKKTPFAAKMGERIYSPKVTLVEDPVDAHSVFPVPFDAEGSPSQKTVVVDGGVLSSFLSDVRYSKKAGCHPTASSVRHQVMQMPKIGIYNFFVSPGELDLAGLKKEMGNGLLITDVMGLHTSNLVTGDFSIGAAGFWIESGRSVYSVKGITVAGNWHELLKRVVEVGNDLKFSYQTGAPSLFIEEITVSGK